MKGDDAVLVVNSFKKGMKLYWWKHFFFFFGDGICSYCEYENFFLWRDIPNMSYTEEILAMQPIVLSENLDAIQ